MYFYYSFRRDEFLKHYHQRSNIESTFSMVKAKFRDHVRGKTALKHQLFGGLCWSGVLHARKSIRPSLWPALPNASVVPTSTCPRNHGKL
jgi:hypothetical protein